MTTPTLTPKKSAQQLLTKLAASEGFTAVVALLEHFATDSVVPGICTTCEGVESSCEPDAEANMCSECETETVQSCLVLAGVI